MDVIHSHHQHPCSTPFTGVLRGYQHEAHQFQMAHPKSILADAYGLGKTPTTIATIANHLPALVICPTYLTNQWFDTLCDFLPTASISLPEGAHAKRQAELLTYADVRVINTEMLRTYDMPSVNTLVIDEAHHIRGRDAKQSIAARQLIWRTPNTYMLTATPYYKSDEDIWHLLHCLDPHTFTSYWTFIREWYAVNWKAPYAPHIYGIAEKKRVDFNKMLTPYMLMRDYTDVHRELPPLIEHPITIELPTAVRRAYTKLKNDWQLAGQPIESVGEVYYLLRQLTMTLTKLDAIQGIVDSIPPPSTTLIYTWYRESANTVSKHLTKNGTPNIVLTGDTPPTQRATLLNTQRVKKRPHVIVATIEALSEGVDLSHIHHVVYAEETYVQGKHTQALARAHRDRTDTSTPVTTPVNVYYVRAKKTIDVRIPVIRTSRGNAGNRELARQLALS